MKYRHSFNPEGKTKIKEKEHLDITGYFPKVGKKKTIPIELSELWVSDENPDDKYGSIRTIGRVSLVDDTVEYHKGYEIYGERPSSNDRRWDCFIYVYGYSHFDENTYINATIHKVWNDIKGSRGWRYDFDVNDIVYGGDKLDLEGKNKAPYFYSYPYATSQREALQRIINGADNVLDKIQYIESRKTLQKPQPSKENKSKKPFRIPIIGGIVALASAWIFNNR